MIKAITNIIYSDFKNSDYREVTLHFSDDTSNLLVSEFAVPDSEPNNIIFAYKKKMGNPIVEKCTWLEIDNPHWVATAENPTLPDFDVKFDGRVFTLHSLIKKIVEAKEEVKNG